MKYLQKGFCFLLALVMLLGCLPIGALAAEETVPATEYRWITDREEVSGSDYTDIPGLAEKLDAIFDGEANVYYDRTCTKMVDTKLGTSRVPNNGVNKYTGGGNAELNVGTSCWIYANAVYYTLFGETTGNGTAGENSEKLNLKSTANKNFTYENFTDWGVRPGVGALIRTSSGHSLIVLGYDEERLTILDGNGNGKGLVAIRVMTWNMLSFRAKFIIQPTQEHFEELYPEESGKQISARTEERLHF